jgi:hypothetical protein
MPTASPRGCAQRRPTLVGEHAQPTPAAYWITSSAVALTILREALASGTARQLPHSAPEPDQRLRRDTPSRRCPAVVQPDTRKFLGFSFMGATPESFSSC